MKSVQSLTALLGRGLLCLLAAVCLLLGVAGLLLPVIPGILFLALGLWILARVSSRAAGYLHNHPGWQRLSRWRRQTRHLGITTRIQLGFLLGCRAVIDGLQKITRR